MVDIGFVERFPEVVPLDTLKGTTGLEKMAVTQKGSRLSVQPVTERIDIVVRLGRNRRRIRSRAEASTMIRCRRRELWTLIVVLGVAIPAAAAGQAAGAAASPPLTLQAMCTGQGAASVMRVHIANNTDRPTAVVLGFTAPGGQTHVVNSVGVSVIRIATGATRRYV